MKWLINSRAYRKAKRLVSATIASPARLLELASSAQRKATHHASGKVADVLEPIKTSYRLIRAYASGAYRDISLENLGLIVAAIIYFVMPLDVLPDFIAAFGLTDDAALLAWTFNRVGAELERFKDWERLDADQDYSNSENDSQA